MVSSIDFIRDSCISHRAEEYQTVTLVANGAEIEFLPLTDFPIVRLSSQIVAKLRPIYQLYKSENKLLSRQPAFFRLVQMLVTVALINFHARRQFPEDSRYFAKLNRQDFEKHKAALLKQAQKYDAKVALKLQSHPHSLNPDLNCQQQRLGWLDVAKKSIYRLISILDNSLHHCQSDRHNSENCGDDNNFNSVNLEELIIKICERIEHLNLVARPGENILAVGIDGSVHGTNSANIQAYERLYRTHQDTRFNFRIYSGQEIGLPVCNSIEETNQIYDFVVTTLKKYGVNFTTTAGVHLHVNVSNSSLSVEDAIAQIGNTTIATAAVSQVLENILPTTRRQNTYAVTFADQVEGHICRHQRPLSKLEYVQKKVKMMQQAVLSDADLLLDKNAAIYEFILGLTYGIAPIQHEYNYQQIIAINSKSPPEIIRQASIIARNPRYTSINITPFLQDPNKPTYEWRVLASCEDSHLQGKLMTFLYRVISYQYQVQRTEVITDHNHNLDYLYFYYPDGRVRTIQNSLWDWLDFTDCLELFTAADFDKINNPDYWQAYNIQNQQYLDLNANQYWATGQFYPAPIIADSASELGNNNYLNHHSQMQEQIEQDTAILDFLNFVFDI